MITIDDFKKIEIKIGKVISAEKVPDSEKLLKLTLDFGGEQRQILSGIAKSYPDPAALVGKEVPALTNLEPKQMMSLESQGMILAADDNGLPVLMHPDKEIPSGSIVK